jgi:hypothetical protein
MADRGPIHCRAAIRSSREAIMSVIRVGSSNTYAEGWDAIFSGRRPATKKAGPAKASKAKATPAPKAGKKKASRVAKKTAVTKPRKPGKSRRG